MAEDDSRPSLVDGKRIKLREIVSSSWPPSRAIYCITNNLTGHRYIGSAENVRRRMVAHLSQLRRGIHHSIKMQWAWKTRGEDVFDVEILEAPEAGDDILARERHFVATLQPEYNFSECVDNPMRGRRHSPEAIEKMRANRRGKGTGPRTFSDAHRMALSRALAGKTRPELKGKQISEIARARMSAAALKRFAAGAINGRARPVEIDGIVYPNGKAAAAALGISHPNLIYRIGRGKGRYI